MELSKEVHGLLERIKKLSQHAQGNEMNASASIETSPNISLKTYDMSRGATEEVTFTLDDLICVENMDFSDNERWLYVSKSSTTHPYTGDLNEWLHEDLNIFSDYKSNQQPQFESGQKKFIDTRTFTRPKKRVSRPSLEQFTDSYSTYGSRDLKTSVTSDDGSSEQELYIPAGNVLNITSGPVQFKLSEPVYNSSFDRILANASDSIDSFQNMSPPSLMNSLCSSTFTTLMDSGYVNQEQVPNDCNNDTFVRISNENLSFNENEDPNTTYSEVQKSKSLRETSLNDTYDLKTKNKISDMNSTFSKPPEVDLNSTYQKNITNKTNDFGYSNLSGTNTFTRKPKLNLTNSLKASCPDINRTFQKSNDFNLDLTFQKLSDSQPDLSEDLKRTIFNQSMELMHPTIETYHSARSGSADSLDERSSSISDCSKGSGTKILNMGDLENLARVQEQSLHQAMSTPKPAKTRLLMLDGDVLSPIQNRLAEEEYLSDSDLSDSCMTARSGYSKRSSSSQGSRMAPLRSSYESLPKSELNVTRPVSNKPEVSQHTLRTVPTMIVKPLEMTRTMVQPQRPQTSQVPAAARPKIRMSGLPRPTSMSATGIPRPTSRIPGPRTLKPPTSRVGQRLPPKSDWMDGCY